MDPALHCPHCNYDLTGLADSRCPECGAHFDLAEIRTLLSTLPKPMSNVGLLGLLIWPAFTIPILFKWSNQLDWGVEFGLLFVCAVLGVPINSGLFVERMLATIRDRKKLGPFYKFGPGAQILVFVLSLALQMTGVVVGIFIVPLVL